ncbi:unnamed protein product, partial [Rotaria magnacalcarata]
MSNHKCQEIMYECTKLTPNSDIFPIEMKMIMKNISNLKKEPLMHLVVVILSGRIGHWSSKTTLNIDIDLDIPLILFWCYYRLSCKIAVHIQLLSFRTFDKFNTLASPLSLYRADKAAYYRSVLNTLWNGPSCYFRQLVKGDVKCENPWLSIVAADHPVSILNILKEDNSQLGADGLFARFIFSARLSPQDIHKRRKCEIDITTGEYTPESHNYPSLAYIMYFIFLMHHDENVELKISEAANEILMRTQNEYNNILTEFQGHEDIICTLFSKSRDHLYRICGFLHLFHQASIYILKTEPRLEYLVFDDNSAEAIQQMIKLAKENINDYLIITPDIAQTAVELMKFYVDTKKFLCGFPLVNHASLEETRIRPSASQEINIERPIEIKDNLLSIRNSITDTTTVLSNNSKLSSTISLNCPFDGATMDATIKKILFYPKRIIL